MTEEQIKKLEAENKNLKQILISECKEHQEFCEQARVKVQSLDEEIEQTRVKICEQIMQFAKYVNKVWGKFDINDLELILLHIKNADE